jgi:hypothetical protein
MKSGASKTGRHPLYNGEPPEYPGFEKAIPAILRELWEVKQLLAETQMTATLKTYSAAEIAQCFGVSYLHLRHNPWTLPNYGRPDIGMKPGRWLFTTVMEWYEIPEDERRRRWEGMSSQERRVAMGAIPGDRRRKNAEGGEEGA